MRSVKLTINPIEDGIDPKNRPLHKSFTNYTSDNVPLSLFVFKLRETKLDKEPNVLGKDPMLISRLIAQQWFPIYPSIPINLFVLNTKFVKFTIVPIYVGIVPIASTII